MDTKPQLRYHPIQEAITLTPTFKHFRKSQLFDLKKDPDQLFNLADDPAYADIHLDYTKKMLSWRMTHEDRILANMFLDVGGVREWRGPRY